MIYGDTRSSTGLAKTHGSYWHDTAKDLAKEIALVRAENLQLCWLVRRYVDPMNIRPEDDDLYWIANERAMEEEDG